MSGYAIGDVLDDTPCTYVAVGPERGQEILPARHFGMRWPERGELAPELARVLAAVLIAASEQVSAEKLALFNVKSPMELQVQALAMAFRGDDTGLTGDVFEWALLLAINSGDPAVSGLISDALTLLQEPNHQPSAVLVAAESGRAVAFSPALPDGATLGTGRRGRPPYVAKILRDATTTNWKSDLLLNSGGRWVGASLKSNPMALRRAIREASSTMYPPRIGITADSTPALVRDPETGAVLVHVPVNGPTLALAKLVLRDVKDAFARHLSVPDAPLRQDISGIGWQLDRWREYPLGYVVEVLLDYAGAGPCVETSSSTATGASIDNAQGSLIVFNALLPAEDWRFAASPPLMSESFIRRKMGAFDPID